MVDKVKPLKLESPSLGGTETDPFPTETDPAEDYLACAGVSLGNSDTNRIGNSSGAAAIQDSTLVNFVPIYRLHGPTFIYNRTGNLTLSSYLNVGETPSNASPQYNWGDRRIIAMAIVCNTNPGTDTTFQLRRRTALGVFTDITGAAVTLTAGNSQAISTGMSVDLTDGWLIACQTNAGITINSPSVYVWTVPI